MVNGDEAQDMTIIEEGSITTCSGDAEKKMRYDTTAQGPAIDWQKKRVRGEGQLTR